MQKSEILNKIIIKKGKDHKIKPVHILCKLKSEVMNIYIYIYIYIYCFLVYFTFKYLIKCIYYVN